MLSRLYKPVNLNLQTNLHVLFFRYLKVEFRVLVQTTDLLLHPPPQKNKTNLQGKENEVVVCVFLGCSAALCVSGRRRRRVGSAHRLSHPDSHWDAAAESNVFPPRECRACQTRCFLCQKNPRHFSSSKAHFLVLPRHSEINRRCFSRHTNQATKSFLPGLWFVFVFFPLQTDFQCKSQSAVMFGKMLFF